MSHVLCRFFQQIYTKSVVVYFLNMLISANLNSDVLGAKLTMIDIDNVVGKRQMGNLLKLVM